MVALNADTPSSDAQNTETPPSEVKTTDTPSPDATAKEEKEQPAPPKETPAKETPKTETPAKETPKPVTPAKEKPVTTTTTPTKQDKSTSEPARSTAKRGNLSYGSWTGTVRGGKPVGSGTLRFTATQTLRCIMNGKRSSITAQEGDRIESAEFDEYGYLYQGTWIKSNGEIKNITQ